MAWKDLARLDDAQETLVEAGPEITWQALVDALPDAFDHDLGRRLAAALQAVPPSRAGEFPAEGSSLPGFEVAASRPGRELRLAGRHRFAAYTLDFRLEPQEGGTRVVATTHAQFRGLSGAAYRWAAVQPVHGLVTRNVLSGVRRRARRAARKLEKAEDASPSP